MDYDDVVKHFGSAPKAAAALSFTRQAIYRWRKDGIPLGTQARLQLMTGGVLKAEQPTMKAAA